MEIGISSCLNLPSADRAGLSVPPFFDARTFCRQLETAFSAMWRQAQLGDARDALGARA